MGTKTCNCVHMQHHLLLGHRHVLRLHVTLALLKQKFPDWSIKPAHLGTPGCIGMFGCTAAHLESLSSRRGARSRNRVSAEITPSSAAFTVLGTWVACLEGVIVVRFWHG